MFIGHYSDKKDFYYLLDPNHRSVISPEATVDIVIVLLFDKA